MTDPSPRLLFDLQGRVAVVTGGGRGIGRAIAEGLSAWGARLVIAEIDRRTGEAAAEAIRESGGDAIRVPVDVTDPRSISSMLDRAEAEFGAVDILVNNAGMSQRTPAEEYSDPDLDRIIALNLSGLYRCMRETARRWIAQKRPGKIINLASFAGVVADPLSAPYAATKGGVVQLTRTCAVEWARHGILVNAIGPGYTRTEMTAATLDNPETEAVIRSKTPLGRAATPAEMAGAAVFLSSSASDYVTGHILMVDGGWTAV
jgi:gluconate 5-dehydrogenase